MWNLLMWNWWNLHYNSSRCTLFYQDNIWVEQKFSRISGAKFIFKKKRRKFIKSWVTGKFENSKLTNRDFVDQPSIGRKFFASVTLVQFRHLMNVKLSSNSAFQSSEFSWSTNCSRRERFFRGSFLFGLRVTMVHCFRQAKLVAKLHLVVPTLNVTSSRLLSIPVVPTTDRGWCLLLYFFFIIKWQKPVNISRSFSALFCSVRCIL